MGSVSGWQDPICYQFSFYAIMSEQSCADLLDIYREFVQELMPFLHRWIELGGIMLSRIHRPVNGYLMNEIRDEEKLFLHFEKLTKLSADAVDEIDLGIEEFRHRLEGFLMTTDWEDNCDIPISSVKQRVYLYEQQGSRLPVYHYLKKLWNTTHRSEDLTVLIMQQMMFYLIELESPWAPWETEDEHQTYQLFLHEALAYGFEKNIHEKKFMWNLCFFLEASSVYHCIFGDLIPIGSEKRLLKELYADAKKRYPESVMFDIIPLIQGGDPLWRDKISDVAKNVLAAEVSEWNLMTNMVDEDMRELLSIADDKGKIKL